jgi:hypothetical protein
MLRDSLGGWPPILLLYPFRLRDPLTGKCVRARYKAERDVIAKRYAIWKITGPAEIRRPLLAVTRPRARWS